MIKRTGLKDIAEALNVSVTTVSRALNDKFDINQNTKALILAKAEELNYRPNAYAVSLRKNEYYTIGVILPSIDHYFFSTLLKGIMNKAHMANYLVLIGESAHDLDKELEIISQFNAHCVTGVIISPSVKSSYRKNLESLRKKRIPYILVDRPTDNDQDSYVKYDDFSGAFLAVEHLIEQGYKKIAIIKGNDFCSISNMRLEGYKRALAQYDFPFRTNYVKTSLHVDFDDNGYNLGRQLLLSKDPPDAIFTITDDIATGVYKAAYELGINIPNKLGIVGYSNSKISSLLSPPLSTIEQPGVAMGEQAFDFLQQSIISGNNKLYKTFDARLIVRSSSIKNNNHYGRTVINSDLNQSDS